MAASREGPERKIADADTFHFFNRMRGPKQFAAQCVATSSGERDFVPGRVLAAKARDVGAGCAREAFDFAEGEQRFELQVVGLRQIVRTQRTFREVAVVGEKDEAGGMIL